jgi:hypothetical protein
VCSCGLHALLRLFHGFIDLTRRLRHFITGSLTSRISESAVWNQPVAAFLRFCQAPPAMTPEVRHFITEVLRVR